MSTTEIAPPMPQEIESQRIVEFQEYQLIPTAETALVSSIDLISEQGNPAKNNEDSIFADADRGIAGVFDGASDVVGFKTPDGMTGGAVASRIAASTLETSSTEQTLTDIIMIANGHIDAIQREFDLDPNSKEARFCTTGAIARARTTESGEKVIDLLQIADSVAIVTRDDGSVEVPLGLYDQDEESMQLWTQMTAEGMTAEQILKDERMQAQIKSKRSESNVTYGVLNGEADAAEFVRTTTIPAEGVSKVILLSDGLFIPKENPSGEDSWDEIARLESEGGIKAVLDYVRSIESTDPDCIRYPRFKQHDDASGAVLDLRVQIAA
ncbi:MAG TPA: protein phosphatase 2C domain-containing protein [Candidatus Saccharimonadales bacterium]